ncbi:MAG: CarD family transcriptional regulator [Oscillospiraceae bacterium]|nr:CarD family transcriptional regulator [Oscillospiraceae bacterium]
MFCVGDKIVYGESGVCTVEQIGPLSGTGPQKDRVYYHLRPLIGSGTYFAPVDTLAYMRPVMSREEAEALIDSMPGIKPAICTDNRFNHVDAFYKELFRQHSCEALVSIVKGLHCRMAERKTKSSRAEATMKRAKEILHGELSIALDMDYKDVEPYILSRIGGQGYRA